MPSAARNYFSNIKTSVTSIWEGMTVTLSYMLRRPITVQYPDRTEVPVRDTLPERYRGFLEVDMDICTACQACQRDCPIGVIDIGLEGKGKERVMSRFDIDLAKCMYCGLCTENCPTGAIQHTAEFEGATISPDNLVLRFVPDATQPIKPYKVQKGVDAYPRKPIGSITRPLIKAWDAVGPVFPDAPPATEEAPPSAAEKKPAKTADQAVEKAKAKPESLKKPEKADAQAEAIKAEAAAPAPDAAAPASDAAAPAPDAAAPAPDTEDSGKSGSDASGEPPKKQPLDEEA